MSFLVEQAGGAATNGTRRILEIDPTSLHERVSVMLGSKHEVERVYEMTTRRDSDDADPQVWDRVLIHGASATREQIGV